jgi:hypothetical protein
MNVIKRFFDALPKHWQKYIEDNDLFKLYDFTAVIRIELGDGSDMYLKYAMAVHDETRGELAVFTEHSGYYVFKTNPDFHWQYMKQEKTPVINPLPPDDEDEEK